MLLELEYSSVLLCQLRDQEIELEVRIGPVYFHQAANRLLFCCFIKCCQAWASQEMVMDGILHGLGLKLYHIVYSFSDHDV